MSFSVSSLRGALGLPATKFPIGIPVFASYVVPPLVCYFAVALLAVTPQTHAVRIALWPVGALLAFRAVVSVDMSLGVPELEFLNIDFLLSMLSIVVNTLLWTFPKKPLVRYIRPANSFPSAIMDALDLVTNLRGHGWDWSRGLYVPRETRPTNRIAFALSVSLSAVAHGLMCGSLHLAIRTFIMSVGSSSQEITIFDETLPFFVRYLRSSIIATLTAFAVYSILQLSYDLLTVPAVLLLGQDPAQWPPAFESPWFATSLNEFWGRRWHQWFRQTFLLGAYPFSLILGRAGTIIGAFLVSGFYHYIMMSMINSQTEMWRMLVSFGMMAPGILVERGFYRLTGRKVGGIAGWAWTMGWLILWGNVMVDGFARAGMFALSSPVDSQSPVRGLIENWVVGFDAWLHTI